MKFSVKYSYSFEMVVAVDDNFEGHLFDLSTLNIFYAFVFHVFQVETLGGSVLLAWLLVIYKSKVSFLLLWFEGRISKQGHRRK